MIAAVVVNWNSGALLERCIRSLQENAPGCEIILVDNASKDSSLGFLERLESPPLLLRNAGNAGFAAAGNQGWRASRADNILFLNPDAEAMTGGAEALARRLGAEPEVWGAGGRLLTAGNNRTVERSVRSFPTVGAVAAEMLLMDEIWPRNPWTRRYRMTEWDHNSLRDVDQPAAACLMVKRAALETLDGFDESFWPAWFEDVDLCKRIRDAGGRIVFEPSAVFRHSGGVSLNSLTPEEFMRPYYRNMIRYFCKHHGPAQAGHVRRCVLAGLYLRGFVSAFGIPCGPGRSPASPSACWRVARAIAGWSGSET